MATELAPMEVFNVKIIEYANGQVEVRTYSEPIGADKLSSVNMTKEQVNRRVELGKKFSKIRREGDLQYNPFAAEIERIQSFEQLELEKERELKNLSDSFNRSKNALYKISRQSRWKYFVTLTFNPDKVARDDYSACCRVLNKWLSHQRERYANDLKYVFVPELHSDKINWHFHGLIDDVGLMKFTDSGKRTKRGQVIFNMDSWSSGFSTAVQIGQTDEDIFRISSYISKYITKDLCMISKGKRRYFRSQNIDEPTEHIAWLKPSEIDNYVNTVLDSMGASLTYEKNIKGFVDVNYRYYKKEKEINAYGSN